MNVTNISILAFAAAAFAQYQSPTIATQIVAPVSIAFQQEPKPKEKIGQIKAGKQYTSGKGTFSITVPPGNWAVDTYKFKAGQLKQDNYDYEEVVFYIPDFGQAYAAGVRRIPQAALAQMGKEEEKQTLSNLANKALHLWRTGYAEEPQPVEENSVQTQFGGGLLRIYLGKRSSMIVKMVGGKGELIDTHIAVLVVKKADLFIYAAVEDDDLQTQSPGQSSADPKPILSKNLQSFFASMTMTDLKGTSSPPDHGLATENSMSCARFSAKASAKVLELATGDAIFDEEATQLAHPSLKILPVSSIHAESAVLVARAAHRPFWIEPVFNLNGLPLRGSNVRGERYQQIAGDTLLDRDAGAWVLSGARAQSRINLQL